jgi:hypothetical protein
MSENIAVAPAKEKREHAARASLGLRSIDARRREC